MKDRYFNTFLINGYIDVGNILIGKIPMLKDQGLISDRPRVRRADTPLGYRGTPAARCQVVVFVFLLIRITFNLAARFRDLLLPF